MNHLCSQLILLPSLQTLSLSQVALSDASLASFLRMLEKQSGLKRLNISGNQHIGSGSLVQLIQKLKSMTRLTDLDLSKLSFNENQNCYRELADLITSLKSLKYLSLLHNNMSDNSASFLIEPLVRSQNIETLRLDFNLLSGVWLEKLCKRVSLVGYKQSQNPLKTIPS